MVICFYLASLVEVGIEPDSVIASGEQFHPEDKLGIKFWTFDLPGRIDGIVGRAADKEVKEPSLIRSVQGTNYHCVNPETHHVYGCKRIKFITWSYLPCQAQQTSQEEAPCRLLRGPA